MRFFSERKNKPFMFGDIFVYSALAVLIVVLLLFFVILPKTTTPKGFKATKNNALVFTYIAKDNSVTVEKQFQPLVLVSSTQTSLTLTVFTDDTKQDFNVIFIDTVDGTCQVIDSTCSQSKDCVHSPKIKDSGAIYCAPHALKISLIGEDGFFDPIVG